MSALQRLVQDVGLADIAPDLEDLDPGISKSFHQILVGAAHEVVVNDDLPDVFPREVVDGVRTDQPGAADHDQFLASNVHMNWRDDG